MSAKKPPDGRTMGSLEATATPGKPHWIRRIYSSRFLFISIAVHLVFAMVAAYLVVSQFQAARKLTFKAGPPSPNPSTRSLEHKVQLAKKQSSMSAPSAAKRITSTGLSKVSLPEMPAMPRLAAPPTKMAGAGGTDVSFNPGGASTSSGASAGGAAVPFFGFHEARGGGMFTGRLYDLKQLKNGTPSNLEQDHAYPDEVGRFVKGGFSESILEKYFEAPNPNYFPQIFIPKIKSEQGPLNFGVGGRVQPKMWLVVFRGNVIPTEGGTYRFVGVGDDIMVVRFNGAIVLDCGAMNPSGRSSQKFYAGDGIELKSDQEWYKGSGVGDPVQVKGGQSYPMEVLIGEWPGGDFKAWLQIEKEGVEYEKDSKGVPILPIFKLSDTTVARPNSEAPRFATQSVIWKAEKMSDSGKN